MFVIDFFRLIWNDSSMEKKYIPSNTIGPGNRKINSIMYVKCHRSTRWKKEKAGCWIADEYFPLSSPMLPAPLTATLPPTISPLSHHFPLFSSMQTPITPLAHHFPLFPLLVFYMNNPLNTLPTCSPCWQPFEDSSLGYKSHQERGERGWGF